MNFAREAWPLVLPPLLFGVAALLWGVRGSLPLLTIGGTFLILLATAILLFFRDPYRTPPTESNIAVSPADGLVVEAATLPNGDKFIAVFLSVFDVHVNRAPIGGEVTKVTRTPGTYLHANSKEGIRGNARVDVELKSAFGPVRFSQLSGLVARKISCRIYVDDTLKLGDRFGLIYFGSRMEVQMPSGAEIRVKVGDRVVAGESIIAVFRT